MNGYTTIRRGCFCFAAWFGLLAAARAQMGEDVLFGGVPLENAIVGRAWALRLRAETQLTADDDEVVEEDVRYAQFPSQMFSSEARLFLEDRSSARARYAMWHNEQDLDAREWSFRVRLPLSVVDVYATSLDEADYLTLRFRRREGGTPDGENVPREYWYAGYDKSFHESLYLSLQYRLMTERGETLGHQLAEYASWMLPSERIVLGQQAAVSSDQDNELGPWYVRVFGTAWLVEELTSLRLQAQHYDTRAALTYQEYVAHLYQRLGGRTFVRLGCRYYTDSDDFSSQAWGLKIQEYFSPAVAGHVGYRAYAHSDDTTFDTFYAGIELLL
ncbi:MAG: hypothetical protein JXR37_02540 [Kiritimatiellae bacterium]|nr:hypothetical protein [Kiritimatiellia bacterium]